MKEIAAALREIAAAIRQGKLSEEDKKAILAECDAVKAECEKCGDPACKDGEICGLKEEEKKAEKPVEEEIKLEKDLLGRTVIAEEDLDEFEPEADGSEYYGKVMEKVGAIEDDEPVCEENDVDECDIAEMIELGKKIR